MPPAMIESWGQTHVGLVRRNNEDSYDCVPEIGFFVVADGMGGANAGERASAIAVRTLADRARAAGNALDAGTVVEAIELANRCIRREAQNDPALDGMGTTVTAALVREGKAWIVNAGDSRAYRLSGGKLECLTEDHTWVREYAQSLSPEQVKHHPYRHVLTKAVGAESTVNADTVEADFTAGDILLLCSDGLHGEVSAEAISEALASDASLESKAAALIQSALGRGAPDNLTIVLVREPEDETTG
ncbi:MAG: protein phosphatase 2C domain-containing protein [Bryobacterales bacterium]|nr:protein phosphatase 2C domain-containing protein [Bryobacterales bacterium]